MSGGGRIVIVKRKKGAHQGHHGGSWKVAYADFVTAMMAFFLVMWIMSMDQGVKDLVQGYFQNPVGFKRSYSGGKNLLSAGNFITNIEVRRTVIINRDEQEERFKEAADRIEEQLARGDVLGGLDAAVEVFITDEGLRIELMETTKESVFFDRASAELKPRFLDVMRIVASGLSKLKSDVVIEGHTDALPFGGGGYTNWELSVDRANAARRFLVREGLTAAHIVEVRGYADLQPKIPSQPLDPRNRRISLLLPFKEVRVETLPTVDAADLYRLEAPTGPTPVGMGGG